jgi:ankyrin repeat protein
VHILKSEVIMRILTLLVMGFLSCSVYVSAQDLATALNNMDTTTALKLIAAGTDINKADENGSSFLITACRYGNDTAIEKFLLSNGAKPDDPRSPKGRTALIVACAYYGDIAMCKLLLNYGADINAVPNDGVTALMMAAKNGKTDLVAYLLMKGADIARKDTGGKTALMYAQNAQIDEYIIKAMKGSRIDKAATIEILTKANP